MKNIMYLLPLLILVGCKEIGLKMTVEGKVINAVTGKPIEGVQIGLDGINPNPVCNNCWEHAALATTDANGEFSFEERTKAGWDYHCEIRDDKDAQGITYLPDYDPNDGNGYSNYSQILDKYKHNKVEMRVVPEAELFLYMDNINYQSSADSITYYVHHQLLGDILGPSTIMGDYHSNRDPKRPGDKMPMGPVRIDWTVQRMGVKQVYSDSIYLQAGEKRVYEIKY